MTVGADKQACAVCSGTGTVFVAMNAFTPSGRQTCPNCGGKGEVTVVLEPLVTSDGLADPHHVGIDWRVEEIVRLRKQVAELQADNTRLLEERRAVDETYMVEHFHRACDVPVLSEPRVPANERVRLRLRLIAEEFCELGEACVPGVFMGPGGFFEQMKEAIEDSDFGVDLTLFADACADLKYVIVGSELEFGIDGRPVFKGVHEANLTKANGPVRADGKRMKPEGWKAFDVGEELRRQGWRS